MKERKERDIKFSLQSLAMRNRKRGGCMGRDLASLGAQGIKSLPAEGGHSCSATFQPTNELRGVPARGASDTNKDCDLLRICNSCLGAIRSIQSPSLTAPLVRPAGQSRKSRPSFSTRIMTNRRRPWWSRAQCRASGPQTRVWGRANSGEPSWTAMWSCDTMNSTVVSECRHTSLHSLIAVILIPVL
jgi:hypothetical protein